MNRLLPFLLVFLYACSPALAIDRSDSRQRHRKTEIYMDGIGFTRDVEAVDVATAVGASWRGIELAQAYRIQEDFNLAASGTLPAPWAKQDTGGGGGDYVADVATGAYNLLLESTDEIQTLTLYHGDHRTIDPTKQPYVEARVTITGTLSADDRIVVGIASDRDATLSDIVRHAWFRMEAANFNITIESDDGTTDDAALDTTIDWVSGTAMTLAIDMSDLSAIDFYVDGVLAGTTSAPLMSGTMQLYIEIQKDAGVVTHSILTDFFEVAALR